MMCGRTAANLGTSASYSSCNRYPGYTLWESAVHLYPTSAKANYNFANELFMKGNTTRDMDTMRESLKYFDAALAIRHDSTFCFNYAYV
jgi:tetratricopeptide (TPR) repeat protein